MPMDIPILSKALVIRPNRAGASPQEGKVAVLYIDPWLTSPAHVTASQEHFHSLHK